MTAMTRTVDTESLNIAARVQEFVRCDVIPEVS